MCDASIESLELSGAGLNHTFQHLEDQLISHDTGQLKKLSVESWALSPTELAQATALCPNLVELTLRQCRPAFRGDNETWERRLEGVGRPTGPTFPPNLSSLDIRETRLFWRGRRDVTGTTPILCRFLQSTTHLTTLEISEEFLSEDVWETLVHQNQSLQMLVLKREGTHMNDLPVDNFQENKLSEDYAGFFDGIFERRREVGQAQRQDARCATLKEILCGIFCCPCRFCCDSKQGCCVWCGICCVISNGRFNPHF